MNRASLEQLGPIRREVVAEQVAQKLLSLIQSGNLRPGQQLPPERELALTLDVSRPSLREALRALSLLGVVRIRPGGGTFITALEPEALLAPIHFFISFDAEHLESLFDARILVESGIARLAAESISDEGIARLRECLDDELVDATNVEQFIALDEEFHKTIFDAVPNPFLRKIASSLHVLGQASRDVTGHIPGVIERSLQDHRRILAAIAARDPQKAAEAMEAHLTHVRDAYRGRNGKRVAPGRGRRSKPSKG